MIFDSLSLWRTYKWPSERFAKGLEFIEALKPDAAEGRVAIDGDNLFCMVQNYETKPRENQQFEAHLHYADIQVLLAGEESILWAPQHELKAVKPYEPDAEMYALIPSPTELVLKPGLFCVLFPQDAHAPCITHGATPSKVRKAVVKVKLK